MLIIINYIVGKNQKINKFELIFSELKSQANVKNNYSYYSLSI